jgi:hypothetical protein
MMERASAATFAQALTRTDALLHRDRFRNGGFGDITPMLGDLAILDVVIRILLRVVQHARRQIPEAGSGAGPTAT